ncbi:hypothetical protein TTHERM_00415740 (macronuclear) [Tetrahymena thermophila SB210]|uniref:Uncharacterized protein n=1 Tax=Tetrahymena thermophila (strain SB210) TaxID=312017 RepID=Q22P19_TETTS|nr:hypothetical protein TTHERM_00415740 [Tetrahymena thermophila SB210]EAR86992.2 hypothetical protein TTHERM_00415740 [Tetrahymena thermophila SB210]|eukprot:XP_001007237.2 hypothetical protein TTHERM_00415740 [Tetrahymena thermophila SB210]
MSNENLQTRSDEKQKGLRLREFEWYEVETKIRQFVFELIDPNINKLMKDRQKVDGFEDLLNQIQEKIQQFDETLIQNERRMKIFDEATKRFNNLHQELGKIKIDIKEKGDSMVKTNQNNEILFTQIQGQIKQQSLQIDSSNMNMEQSVKQMDKFKQEISYLIDNQSSKQTKLKEEIKAYMTEQSEIQQEMNNSINTLQSSLGQKGIHIKQNTEIINQLQKRMLQNENDIFNINKKLEDIPILQQKVQLIQQCIDKQQKDLSMLCSFIDLHIPLNTYTQITECLYACISNEAQKKLVDFDEKQFKILNNRLQQQETQQLNQSNELNYEKQNVPISIDFSEINKLFQDKISNIVKRNAKFKKISLNRQKLLKNQNKEERLSSQQKEQNQNDVNLNNFYEQNTEEKYSIPAVQQTQQENTNNSQEFNEVFPKQLAQSNSNIQQNQLKSSNQASTQNSRKDQRYFDQSSKTNRAYSPDGNEEEILSVEEIIAKELSSPKFYQKVEDQFKQYTHKFENQQQEFQLKINKQLEEREEYNQIQYNRCYEMIEQEQNKTNSMRLGLSNTVDAQNDSLNTIQQCLQLIQQANHIFESNVFHLNQFCTIITHLFLQDEKDKNSIGLYGFRESPIDQNTGFQQNFCQQDNQRINQNSQRGFISNIHFDDKCLSCSGQQIQINQLFKLACLAYKPQPVYLDGKNYTRIDLLQFCQKILSSISLDPSHNKAQPQKIYKKVLRQSIRLDDQKDQTKQQTNNEAFLQETCRSLNEPSTHHVGTSNTLSQTIDQGCSTYRPSLLNQSNNNLENEINLLNNSLTSREQKEGNYYEIQESNPRAQLRSREQNFFQQEQSYCQEDKLKRFSSLDSKQIQVNDFNFNQLTCSQIKITTQHKVRKLIQSKPNQKSQTQQNNEQFQLNRTSINFSKNPQNNKEKVSSYEKRRQFIMKQSIVSLNNSSINH